MLRLLVRRLNMAQIQNDKVNLTQDSDRPKSSVSCSFFYSLIWIMSQERDIANIVISATMAPPTCCLLNFML